MEAWFMEIAKGIGKLFLNPLIYWFILLMLFAGYRRIKRERMNFGVKVFDVFSEGKHMWSVSIISGIVISLIALGAGLVFTYETILLISIVTIILSLSLKFAMLSASYTIGISYILLLFLPLILENQSYVNPDLFSQTNFTGLILLLGIFLIVEAFLLSRIKDNDTYPELTLGNRGVWTGQQHVKKLSLIPFFTLIPTGLITPIAPFWPYFSIGGEEFSILLVPFIIGFDHIIKGSLPRSAAVKLAKSIGLLGGIVLLLAVGSVYVPSLSVIAVLIAIIGREFINYKLRVKDREKLAYFNQTDRGLKVLGVIPETPADRLDILVGETIVKVNGQNVNNVNEFYLGLQASGASFKLELLDVAGEIRFIQSALYEGDHHELGILFTTEPYRQQLKHYKKETSNA
ncbi:PDZ domain-containing protein [Virgibacillus profundi]|nr:PDZ domain-containing protein [Virgibacillus profundi]